MKGFMKTLKIKTNIMQCRGKRVQILCVLTQLQNLKDLKAYLVEIQAKKVKTKNKIVKERDN